MPLRRQAVEYLLVRRRPDLYWDPSLPVQGIGVALDRLSDDYRYFCAGRCSWNAGPASNFYSLGCVAYELACGSPPFVSDNYLELAAQHLRAKIVPPSSRGSILGVSRDAVLLKLLARSGGGPLRPN